MKFAKEGEQPLVSVCLLVYNHEKYIATAIESILMQETHFPCEFIIAEDCSTDTTREIILSYATKYPIKLILQEKNVGAGKNSKDLFEAPTGNYVAFFEGDDSWIDPLKLKKQIAVMEENDRVVLCYSNAVINDAHNSESAIYFKDNNKPKQQVDKYSILKHCIIPTCTIVYRNRMLTFPDWFHQAHAGAYFLYYLLSKYGDLYYYDEPLALYNHHYNGLSRKTNLSRMLYNDALLNYKLVEYFDGDDDIFKIVVEKNIAAINDLFHRREFGLAIRLFWKLPMSYFIGSCKMYGTFSKLFIKVHFLLFLSKNQKKTVY